MDELDLNLGALELKVTLVTRQVYRLGQPYEDWLICEIAASVPSFWGKLKWEVMPLELEELANDLSKMHAEFPVLGKVEFKPTYRNVALSFQLTRTGQVLGYFALCPDTHDDTVLKGSFHIDQTYLPIIARSIRAFLQSSANYVAEDVANDDL